MRYKAAEKLEIIRLVEGSALPVKQILGKIGIPRSTFHRWCDLYRTGGAGRSPISSRPDLEPHPGRYQGQDHRAGIGGA